MKIRKAEEQDIEKITQNNVLLALETENKSLDFKTVYDGVKNIILNNMKGFYLIIEIDNKIIGQLMITYEWSDWNNMNIWWIQSVYVNKEYRQKNIFNKLYNNIKVIAKKNNIKILKLYVYKKNKLAKIVYEKIGMKKELYDIYTYNI
jgi:ribosomal protein S18 acetylase RimI-like enzyme